MKDVHKNMIVLLVIIMIVAVVAEYVELDTPFYWMAILFSVTGWLIVSPFKFYDDVS